MNLRYLLLGLAVSSQIVFSKRNLAATSSLAVDGQNKPPPTMSGWNAGDCLDDLHFADTYGSSTGLCDGPCPLPPVPVEVIAEGSELTLPEGCTDGTEEACFASRKLVRLTKASSAAKAAAALDDSEESDDANSTSKANPSKTQRGNNTRNDSAGVPPARSGPGSSTPTATPTATATVTVDLPPVYTVPSSMGSGSVPGANGYMYNFQTRVSLNGSRDSVTKYDTYCYHMHMYNFEYNSVAPSHNDDSPLDFEVTGYTMVGLAPELCSYQPWVSIDFPIDHDTQVQTIGNEFGLPCGYYVEYQWSGKDSVTFNINTNYAIVNSLSIFLLFVIGLMYY